MKRAVLSTLWACAVLLCGINAAAASEKGAEDPATGSICVRIAEDKVSELLRVIKSAKGRIRRTSDNDHVCWQGEGYKSFSVPNGLERWTIRTLTSAGYASAEHGFGTAGGSGFSKRRVARQYVYGGQITPANLQGVMQEIECKLKTKLETRFSEVVVRRNCKTEWGYPELCWNAWVGGHLSDSRGLSPKDMENVLDKSFWFSVRLEIWMTDFEKYTDFDLNDVGPQFRVDAAVISSKFAKYPADRQPPGDRFQPLGAFKSGVDPDEIDGYIAIRMLNDIVDAPMKCRK